MAEPEPRLEAKMEVDDGAPAERTKTEDAEMSGGPSVTDEFLQLYLEGKASVTPNPENFKEVCFNVAKAVLKKFGGPQQYLEQTITNLAEFAAQLKAKYPENTTLTYVKSLPDNVETVVHVHLADLSFSPQASTRPPPYQTTSLSLLDEFLTNTFLTSGSEVPLLLWDGPSPSDTIEYGWVCYLKGAARAQTLLFLAKLAMDAKWDLSVLHPALFASMQGIACKRGTLLRDLQSIALENAAIAARGGIRKALDCLGWLGKLLLLRDKGYSSEDVLKRWNASASKESQLVGGKATGLRFLLNCPEGITALLLRHASQYGSNIAFSEDCWQNKKIQFNFATRCPHKEWTDRLRVSEQGLLLALETICLAHDEKMPEARTKVSKAVMEEFLLHAQIVVDVQRALVDDMGVPKDLAQSVVDSFKTGDITLRLELENALSEKDKAWQCAQLTQVQEILRKHRGQQEFQFPVEAANRNIAATKLEREEFELMLKQIEPLSSKYVTFLFFSQQKHQKKSETQARRQDV